MIKQRMADDLCFCYTIWHVCSADPQSIGHVRLFVIHGIESSVVGSDASDKRCASVLQSIVDETIGALNRHWRVVLSLGP